MALTEKHVQAVLVHLSDDPLWKKEKPYRLMIIEPGGEMRFVSNCKYSHHTVPLSDLKTFDMECSLDTIGFGLIKSVPRYLPTWVDLAEGDENAAVLAYLEDSVRVTRGHCNTDIVIAIDWRVRGHFKNLRLNIC
jgi:hypothetical protein